MYAVCLSLMIGGITLFLGVLVIAWLDEREDRFANIKYDRRLGTVVSWERLAMHNYRSWEEKRAALNRARHALDITIESIAANGEIHLKVKEPRAIREALDEWNKLIDSLR